MQLAINVAYGLGRLRSRDIPALVDLNAEASLPAWWSALLLAGLSALAATLAWSDDSRRRAPLWIAASAVFIYLSFDEVVGQEHVIRTLRNALTSGRIHHAYLFAGPRGTGKTTTARLLAKAVNCLAPEEQRPCNECTICQAVNEGRLLDLIEIDAASNTGVDDVRELREKVGFRPNEARYKVYVIDEVHMLSNAAFNALLKTLEEPPPHAIFVLATTESHKIPATVLSRCQRFDFRRIPISQIVDRLAWMTEQEHIEADREALALVARHEVEIAVAVHISQRH